MKTDMSALARLLAGIAEGAGAPPHIRHIDGLRVEFASFGDMLEPTVAQRNLLAAAFAGPLVLEARLGRTLERHEAQLHDPDGWYGTVRGLFSVGPFETEAQAMTDLALSLAGLQVVPLRGEAIAAEASMRAFRSPAGYDVDVSGVPEELRDEVVAAIDAQFAEMGVTPQQAKELGLVGRAVAVPIDD